MCNVGKKFGGTRIKELQRVYTMHHLRVGDHVTYYKAPFQRHAIVTSLDVAEATMTLVRLVFRDAGRKLKQPRVGVKTVQSVQLRKECGSHVCRVVYDGPCFADADVATRASSLLGMQVRSPYTPTASKIAVWCRTGNNHDVIKQILKLECDSRAQPNV